MNGIDCRLRGVIEWYLLVRSLSATANSGKMAHLVTAGTDLVIYWAVDVATLMQCYSTCWTSMKFFIVPQAVGYEVLLPCWSPAPELPSVTGSSWPLLCS